MSSTRHASEDSPLALHKWMSSPEYALRRGLPGKIVAAKAQLYRSPKVRSLLFYLQWLSQQEGGLNAVAHDLIEMFQDRLCTPTMRAIGRRTPNDSERNQIEEELSWGRSAASNLAELLYGSGPSDFHSRCERYANAFLGEFLQLLCAQPELDIEEIARAKWSAEAPYFFDPIGAVEEYRSAKKAEHAERIVVTSAGKIIHGVLDRVLATRRMEVIEAPAGYGKTHAVESWCATHTGEARLVSLSGITHRTGFFRAIGAALGIGVINQSSAKLQAKIESLAASADLMIIFDEAHYLWPQYLRVQSTPELVNWVNTALVNQGVPVALICTDQFAKLKARVEKQTGWTSEQFLHRTFRYTKLTERPTKPDLERVTTHLLSMRWSDDEQIWSARHQCAPSPSAIKAIVGYAGSNPLPLPSIRSIIVDARFIAQREGRDTIPPGAITEAISGQQVSDLAVRQAFDPSSAAARSRTPAPTVQLADRESEPLTPRDEHMSSFSAVLPANSRRPNRADPAKA